MTPHLAVRRYGVRYGAGNKTGFTSLRDAINWARENAALVYQIYRYRA